MRINCPRLLSLLPVALLPSLGATVLAMFQVDLQQQLLSGAAGSLALRPDDEVARKLAMLIQGACQGLGPAAAARQFGFSKQRWCQLRQAYCDRGSDALRSQKRGPKRPSRRTDEVVRQVIRHRFLDPAAAAAVIAQKLRHGGFALSTRSVERILAPYGLQKNTPRLPPQR